MKYAPRIALVVLSSVQLLVSGCSGGGSSLADTINNFFGGDADAAADAFASLTGLGLDAGLGGLGDGGAGGEGGGSGGGGISDLGGGLNGGGLGGGLNGAATIHNPEPGSMALFGGGLAGTAFLSRRRRKRSKRSHLLKS